MYDTHTPLPIHPSIYALVLGERGPGREEVAQGLGHLAHQLLAVLGVPHAHRRVDRPVVRAPQRGRQAEAHLVLALGLLRLPPLLDGERLDRLELAREEVAPVQLLPLSGDWEV